MRDVPESMLSLSEDDGKDSEQGMFTKGVKKNTDWNDRGCSRVCAALV